jgi:hypothetical protein
VGEVATQDDHDHPLYSQPLPLSPRRPSWAEFETDGAYVTGLVERALPLLIFGVLSMLIILCWSCCRCCCDKCRLRPVEGKTNVKGGLLVALLVLVVCCFALLVFGLAMDNAQSDALTSVAPTITTLTSWQPDITDATGTLEDDADEVQTLSASLQAYNAAFFTNANFVTLDSIMAGIETSAASVNSEASAADLSGFEDDISSETDSIDKMRRLAVRVLLGVLLGVLLAQALVGALNAWNKVCVPKKNCLCHS